jgi:hypothetical protein
MDELEEIMGSVRHHVKIATSGLMQISNNVKYTDLLRYRITIVKSFLADAMRALDVIERNLAEPPTGETGAELSE